jgi:SNF family Na+-dependent transporter
MEAAKFEEINFLNASTNLITLSRHFCKLFSFNLVIGDILQCLNLVNMMQVWSVVFFAMLVMMGISSQFATVEVVITSIKDSGVLEKYVKRHEFLVAIVCFVTFIVGIPYIFEVSSQIAASVNKNT